MQTWYHCENTYPFVPPEILTSADSVRGSLPNKYCDPKIAADLFLEWAEVHNNYYGTSWAEVTPRLERGIDVLMDIDVQGAERVLTRFPEAHSIFIMPPSYAALEQRLAQRGLDDPQVIARRLAVSQWEMRRADRYKYVIINDDARRASEVLSAIILEKRYRQEHVRGRVHEILKDFQQRGHPPI